MVRPAPIAWQSNQVLTLYSSRAQPPVLSVFAFSLQLSYKYSRATRDVELVGNSHGTLS